MLLLNRSTSERACRPPPCDRNSSSPPAPLTTPPPAQAGSLALEQRLYVLSDATNAAAASTSASDGARQARRSPRSVAPKRALGHAARFQKRTLGVGHSHEKFLIQTWGRFASQSASHGLGVDSSARPASGATRAAEAIAHRAAAVASTSASVRYYVIRARHVPSRACEGAPVRAGAPNSETRTSLKRGAAHAQAARGACRAADSAPRKRHCAVSAFPCVDGATRVRMRAAGCSSPASARPRHTPDLGTARAARRLARTGHGRA